jgi:hypothetical protein
LKTALETDWPSTLARVGIAGISIAPQRLQVLETVIEPPWEYPEPPKVIRADGTEQTWDVFVRSLFPFVQAQLSEWVGSEVLPNAKTLDDIARTVGHDLFVTPDAPVVLLARNHARHALRRMKVHVQTEISSIPMPVERALYDEVGVSSSVIPVTGGRQFRVIAVQAPGKDVTSLVEEVSLTAPKTSG